MKKRNEHIQKRLRKKAFRDFNDYPQQSAEAVIEGEKKEIIATIPLGTNPKRIEEKLR